MDKEKLTKHIQDVLTEFEDSPELLSALNGLQIAAPINVIVRELKAQGLLSKDFDEKVKEEFKEL